MSQTELNDKNIKPNDDLIFSIIGDKQLLWEQVMTYLYNNNKNVSEEWKYYNDGKIWLFRALKKKNTLFWIRIIEDTFRIAFWFAGRLEPEIMQSNLPDNLKSQYKNAKPFNKSRSIYIDMQDSVDFENVKKLIDLKIKN
ncbi:DUF3788 family protein [Marinifilum caeruleilacunae]|uniref:DUF3788 family protein n=1 Tax=Marinifilum caeruleilacunae TaxID=2499076 RepID=A0ABX1X1J9_9BACT|nr:DUF3788 family protein [Marinifilum caeruleilacunae]NOU62294.1 DUF3788 family protein [Marinifilum caeruleilacunae]